MIFDTLNNLPNYLGMAPALDAVIEFIMARDITALPTGKTRIEGSECFVTVSDCTPRDSRTADFERHELFCLLETDLSGSELFETALGEMAVRKPYDEASDTEYGSASMSAAGILCEGRFVLFLAGEAHRSALKMQGSGKLRRAVFYIPAEIPDEPEEPLSSNG